MKHGVYHTSSSIVVVVVVVVSLGL